MTVAEPSSTTIDASPQEPILTPSCGVRPTLVGPEMVEQWRSEKTRFELRVAILALTQLYGELGARRCRVLRLHDGPSPYSDGLAADVSVLELPGVKVAAAGLNYKLPNWICRRMNWLMPFGSGVLETATYDGLKIRLQVPVGGYRKECNAFSEWFAIGPTGRVLTERVVRFEA